MRDLKPGERLAVLPFAASAATEALPPGWLDAEGGADAREALETALDRLVPGGGTDLPMAIQAAARLAAAVPARARRVILLTDGDPDHAPDEAALTQTRLELDRLQVEFGALVAGMPEAARRLRAYVARESEAVVLLDGSSRFPDRLLRALARERGKGEMLPAPRGIRWLSGGTDNELEALTPTRMQALQLTPGAGSVIAEATLLDGGLYPFAARRSVGAGEVVALAWGPEWEPEPEAGGRGLTGLVERLAREADRGLTADVEGDHLVLRLPEARGVGSLEVTVTGPAGDGADTRRTRLLEIESGLFRGPAPSGPVVAARAVLGGVERPLRLPARPPAEHRGAGVDEAALRRIAGAGGGMRLPQGTAPPPGPRPKGPPLAPWLLLLGAMLLVIDRALTEGGSPSIRSPGEGASRS